VVNVDSDDMDACRFADLAEHVHWTMFRIAAAIRRREYADASDDDLTLTQCSIIYVLRRDGATRLSDLAAHEGVRAPTMTIAISRLEKLGMVKRKRDPADKRVLWVEATTKGLVAQRNAVAQTVDGMRRTLSTAELRALQAAMEPLERLALAAERS
jgi:DNA-binding MarR family transcriptional regulator